MTVTYAVTGTLTLGPRLLDEDPPVTGCWEVRHNDNLGLGGESGDRGALGGSSVPASELQAEERASLNPTAILQGFLTRLASPPSRMECTLAM